MGPRLVILGLLALVACGDEERPARTAGTVPSGLVAPTAATILSAPAGSGCAGVGTIGAVDRLGAMLVVQTVVLTWDPDLSHAGGLAPPAAPLVERALDTLRCDQSPRAVSRHSRAVAKLLGWDWKLLRAEPYLVRLGFTDRAKISAFQERIVTEIGQPVFDVLAHDPSWLEYIITRRLVRAEPPPGRTVALDPGWFGPSAAYAQVPTFDWQPEEPWKFQYGPPWVHVEGHVSVICDSTVPQSVDEGRVRANVDPQQWNVCGEYWSPPDPNNASGPPLDGAKFVKPTWQPTGPCTTPHEPFDRPDSETEPGTLYGVPPPPQYLFEYFFVPGSIYSPLGDSWFKNILSIQAVPTTHTLVTGTVVPAHHIDYALGLCGTGDNVDGAMGGGIYGVPLKTILDSGDIEVWSDGTRTHVKARKTFQFTGSVTNWLTQLNPKLHELNEELGELACCR